jgi:transcriptional regulator with XRE-family HTH domain
MEIGLKFFDGLGPALRRLREKAGLTQTEVAARTAIAQSRLSRYENGRKLPELTTLGQLLACYGENLVGLHRALEEAQGAPSAPANDAELTARIRAILGELGYSQPSPEPKT